MCRSTLGVGWAWGWMGEFYDCNFNQMFGMQLRNGEPLYLWDISPEFMEGASVQAGAHCR